MRFVRAKSLAAFSHGSSGCWEAAVTKEHCVASSHSSFLGPGIGYIGLDVVTETGIGSEQMVSQVGGREANNAPIRVVNGNRDRLGAVGEPDGGPAGQ